MKPASFSHGLSLARQQRGATLIVALIFLMVLALLGATAAQNSVLEERMAGNTRDRDLAFQAAEAALKDAELNIATLRTQMGTGPGLVIADSCAVPNVPPCYLSHGNDAAYWTNTFVWNTTNARNPTQSLNQVAAQPLYMVERMPGGAGGLETYRVTARGVGKSANAIAITQSVINYTP
jgi:type IV pilus assembly protein PilX